MSLNFFVSGIHKEGGGSGGTAPSGSVRSLISGFIDPYWC